MYITGDVKSVDLYLLQDIENQIDDSRPIKLIHHI